MSVSIIIPTFQGAKWLEQNLPVIFSQDYEGEIELVAIDSSSTDGTRDLLQAHGAKVWTIPQTQFSHGYARNLGVQYASHSTIVFMSQDVLPTSNRWLRELAGLLEADERIAAAHIRQITRPDATPLERFFHEQMYPPTRKIFSLREGEPVTLDKIFFSNVCSITHRDLCLRFPFDEKLIMSEDQAYAKALLKAGYAVLYEGSLSVVHSHHYDPISLFRRNFDSAYSLLNITEETSSDLVGAGIRFTWAEIKYLIREREWRWLLAVPVYESARGMGRLLGRRADRMPNWLRKRLSLHSMYWAFYRQKRERLATFKDGSQSRQRNRE